MAKVVKTTPARSIIERLVNVQETVICTRHRDNLLTCSCWSLQLYMAVQLMKKGFAVGTLVDRLRKKETVDQSVVTKKLEMARNDVSEAEVILDEVQRWDAN